jgi:hypothetical protein
LAGWLGVFSTRLGRVADKVDHLSDAIETAEGDEAIRLCEQFDFLRKRSLARDAAAVVLGALGGGATCAAVLALFVGFLWQILVARILFAFLVRHHRHPRCVDRFRHRDADWLGKGLRAQAKRSGDALAAGGEPRENDRL